MRLSDRIRAKVTGPRQPAPPEEEPPPPPPVVPGDLDLERANLHRAQRLLQAAGVRFFMVPVDARTAPRFGIRAADLPAVIAAAVAADPAPAVSIMTGERVRTVDPATLVEAPPQPGDVLLVHDRPDATRPIDVLLGARPAVIEPWQPHGGCHRWTLPNRLAMDIDLDRAEWTTTSVLGVEDLPTITDLTETDITQVQFDVDAVMLWADGSDAAWHEKRRNVLATHGEAVPDAVDPARFRDHGELRYSLRSLNMYAPWIRRVFLLTDGQRPVWLADDDRIVVIDHREVFGDDGVLPTFNSHAISARMHHVPGLAEHFLYLNDDVFFGRPVAPEQWFDSLGTPLYHVTQSRIAGRSVAGVGSPVRARWHVADLVERDFGVRPHQVFQHAPHPMRRSNLAELESRYPAEFAATWSHPFRSGHDIEIVWLHNYVGYLTGRARPARGVGYSYFSLGVPGVAEDMRGILQRRHKDVFCVNDEDSVELDSAALQFLPEFLEEYWPHAAPWERRSDPAS